MKRKIDICRKCGKFRHDDNGMMCLASDDEKVRLFLLENVGILLLRNLGIPKDFFFDEDRKDDFNEKDVPDDCEMKTEYFVSEWNNEKEK